MNAKKLQYLRPIPIPLQERTLPRLLAARALERGDAPYLVVGDRSVSYREIDAVTTTLAAGFVRIGISPGTHVAVMMDNSPDMLFTLFGLAKAGAVAVPVNTASLGQLLATYLTSVDSAALVIDAKLADRYAQVRALCPGITRIVISQGKDMAMSGRSERNDLAIASLDELSAGSTCEPRVTLPDPLFRDPLQITFTSGTSGPSKGVVGTHSSLISSAVGYAQAFGYQTDDRLYVCLPLFHSNGYVSSALAALVAGAAIALAPRFSVSRFWDEIRAAAATQFNALGSMMNFLWAEPERPDDADNPVRLCFAVPPPEFAPAFEQRFGLRITSCYALTDYGTAALLRPDRPDSKWRSAGQIRPEMDVAILDDDDVAVPDGGPGHICLRATEPWVAAQGYYNLPEATLASRRNLWFHTGDMGRLDDDGYLYFEGRSSDGIRRRGENVSAFEVEQILLGHPDVADIAAFGVKAGTSEDEVMVSVVPRGGHLVDPEDLVRFGAANMSYFMVPRYVDVVDDLPRTATAKVEKAVLRADAEARLGEIWDRESRGIIIRRT